MRSLLVLLFLLVPSVTLLAGENRPVPKKTEIDPANVRRILAQLRSAAGENSREATPRRGDALADFYVRRLAEFCVEEKIPPRDFLAALGVGLDASDFLRRHPLTRTTFKTMDTDDEREGRRRVLGEPTLRKRPDWLLHFALSAALTAATSAEAAELLGVAKELQDSLGQSGFSFGDLAADYAGVALASRLLQEPARLADLAKSFSGDAYLPPVDDLEEGLSLKQLTEKYGDPEGERFQRACAGVRQRIHKLDVNKAGTRK